MLPVITELFGKMRREPSDVDAHNIANREIQIAVAALLVELAHADYQYLPIELTKMHEILKRFYDLDDREINKLIAQAEQRVDKSVSLDEFSKLLDANLSPPDKGYVLELLWEVALVDGSIDKYEEYLIRKLADLLHVSHKGYISAKLKAEKSVREK